MTSEIGNITNIYANSKSKLKSKFYRFMEDSDFTWDSDQSVITIYEHDLLKVDKCENSISKSLLLGSEIEAGSYFHSIIGEHLVTRYDKFNS